MIERVMFKFAILKEKKMASRGPAVTAWENMFGGIEEGPRRLV